MADWDDVRRVALALPETAEDVRRGSLMWHVRDALFAWERPLRQGDLAALELPVQPGPVLATRVADLGVREALIAEAPAVYFTTPHFTTYPAVLAWLERLDAGDLEEIVTDAWLARAPKKLAAQYLAQRRP